MAKRETKGFKADYPDEGTVRAVVSKLGIIDKDGDVVLPTAFKSGQDIILCSWNHDWNKLPVGKGKIEVRGDEAIFTGKFFIDTQHGRDTYETVKQLGNLQQWSWGFSIPKGGSYTGTKDGQRVRFIRDTVAHEVSPVLVGANPETRTLSVKGFQPDEDEDIDVELKAVWTTAFINDLPDSAFLYVEDGDKDDEGKTVPRSKRHFPYKGSDGSIDLPHLRNALARIPQSNAPGLDKEAVTARAQRILAGTKSADEDDEELKADGEEDKAMMMECPECGEPMEEGGTCEECGYSADEAKGDAFDEEQDSEEKSALVVIAREAIGNLMLSEISNENFRAKAAAPLLQAMRYVEIFEEESLLGDYTENDARIDSKVSEWLAELKGQLPAEKTAKRYHEQADGLLDDLHAFVERTNSLAELKRNSGRDLSPTNRDKLQVIRESLASADDALESLLTTETKETDEELARKRKAEARDRRLAEANLRAKTFED